VGGRYHDGSLRGSEVPYSNELYMTSGHIWVRHTRNMPSLSLFAVSGCWTDLPLQESAVLPAQDSLKDCPGVEPPISAQCFEA